MRLTFLFVVLGAVMACGKHSGSADAPSTTGDGGTDVLSNGDANVDATASSADCTSYCTAIQAACTGANAQYTSVATCIASCSHLPAGTSGAQSGNSLACRATHAQLAETTPATHCVHAGPSGSGACGMSCEGFCAIAPAVCPTEVPAATCAAVCAAIATNPPYSTAITTGDTIECRIFYATAAAADPTPNCVELGGSGTRCQ